MEYQVNPTGTGTNLSEEFKNSPDLLRKVNDLLDKSKGKIDNLNVTAEKFKSALDLEKQLAALHSMAKQTGITGDELKAVKTKWKEAKDECTAYTRQLNGLDPKAIRALGIESELLSQKQKGLLGKLEQVNAEWANMKKHSISVLTLDAAGRKLGNTLKSVGGSILGILGLAGGLAGAVTMLYQAYQAAKGLGKEAHSIGLNLGIIGVGVKKSFDPNLFTAVRQNIDTLKDSYSYTRAESIALMKAVGDNGVGSPITTADFLKLTDVVALYQRISGLSPEMGMKIAYDGMRRFDRSIDQVSGTILAMEGDSRVAGASFDSWTSSVMNITGQFEDFGISADQVSANLSKVYTSSFYASRGFKMTMGQAEKLTGTLLKLTRGADMSENAIAGISLDMDSYKHLPAKERLQEVKKGLLSNDKNTILEFTQAWERKVRRITGNGKVSVVDLQHGAQADGWTMDDNFGVNLAEAFNTGDKDKATDTVAGIFLKLGDDANKTLADQMARDHDQIKADPMVQELILRFRENGVDDIEMFMEGLFNTAMEQSLTLENFIEGSLLPGFEKILDKIKEAVPALGGITDSLKDVEKLGVNLFLLTGGLALGGPMLLKFGGHIAKTIFTKDEKTLAKLAAEKANKKAAKSLGKTVASSADDLGKLGSRGANPFLELGEDVAKTGGKPGFWARRAAAFKNGLKGPGGWKSRLGLAVGGLVAGNLVFGGSAEAAGDPNLNTFTYGKYLGKSFGLDEPKDYSKMSPMDRIRSMPGDMYGVGKVMWHQTHVRDWARFSGKASAWNTDDVVPYQDQANRRVLKGNLASRAGQLASMGVDKGDLKRALAGDVEALSRINKQLNKMNSNMTASTELIQSSLGNSVVNVSEISNSLKDRLEDPSKKAVQDMLQLDFPGTMTKIVDKFTLFKTDLNDLLNTDTSEVDLGVGGASSFQNDSHFSGDAFKDFMNKGLSNLRQYQTFGTARGRQHNGQDFITTERGLTRGGKVLQSKMTDWGGMMDIDYGNGIVERMLHLSSETIKKTKVGQMVPANYLIKAMRWSEAGGGKTGKSRKYNIGTVEHIHSEIRKNGVLQDMGHSVEEIKRNYSKAYSININVNSDKDKDKIVKGVQGLAPVPPNIKTS